MVDRLSALMDIRTPTDDERTEVAEVMHVSLNLPSGFVEERAAKLPIERMLCAVDENRIVAAVGAREFTQRFGREDLSMSGIWGVVTLPEYRGTGLASRVIGQILHDARERGTLVSALYPATLRPYRRLGYELAGTFTEHQVPLDDLPGGGELDVVEYDPRHDLDEVRTCYRRSVRDANGPIDCDEARWWPERIMGPGPKEKIHRAVVARGTEGVEAYASFVLENVPGDLSITFQIECKHLVFSTIDGLRSLLRYLHAFRGVGQTLRFVGPPADPLAMLVEEQRVRPVRTFRWMLRLLDVPGAIAARGYPPISGEAVISVEDEMFADNRGPWRVEADGGKVTVTEGGAAGDALEMDIRTLSSMYSGYLAPSDAGRLGLIDGDHSAIGFLADLFAGPAPWIHDFF